MRDDVVLPLCQGKIPTVNAVADFGYGFRTRRRASCSPPGIAVRIETHIDRDRCGTGKSGSLFSRCSILAVRTLAVKCPSSILIRLNEFAMPTLSGPFKLPQPKKGGPHVWNSISLLSRFLFNQLRNFYRFIYVCQCRTSVPRTCTGITRENAYNVQIR